VTLAAIVDNIDYTTAYFQMSNFAALRTPDPDTIPPFAGLTHLALLTSGSAPLPPHYWQKRPLPGFRAAVFAAARNRDGRLFGIRGGNHPLRRGAGNSFLPSTVSRCAKVRVLSEHKLITAHHPVRLMASKVRNGTNITRRSAAQATSEDRAGLA